MDANEVAQALDAHPQAVAVLMTYSDSSTGVRNDVAAVCRVARERNVLALVDGVSAMAGMPFGFDEWEVDVAITASQKCLMSSTGLAFVALSHRAWAVNARAGLPRNYWDFGAIRTSLNQGPARDAGLDSRAPRVAGGQKRCAQFTRRVWTVSIAVMQTCPSAPELASRRWA